MDKKISKLPGLSDPELGGFTQGLTELITLNDYNDMEVRAVSTTKQEQDPAIIAKQIDDWLFEEYEEVPFP